MFLTWNKKGMGIITEGRKQDLKILFIIYENKSPFLVKEGVFCP